MTTPLLIQGTALALPLRDASVHVCVCSPPYYSLRDYGTETWQGGDLDCTHQPSADKILREYVAGSTLQGGKSNQANAGLSRSAFGSAGTCPRCGATCVDQQLGLEESPDLYIAAMVQVFREVKRVLHPMGTCWVNIGDAMRDKQLLGMPWRLALALQADGWILRSEIIWHKLNGLPESVQDRPTRSHEQVFLFAKQPHYFFDAQAVREPGSHNTHMRFANGGAPRTNGHKWAESHGGSKPNDWALEQVEGRACRSVWSLASEPSGFQHYAAFPQALVRRCLLAGAPSQVCSQCGKPWVRETERSALQGEAVIQQTDRPAAAVRGVSQSSMLRTNGRTYRTTTTTGFTASCACAAGTQPATILDPFCGSGTTLLVARELGHYAIGLDLSYPYLHDIARERLGLAALKAWQKGAAPRQDRFDDLPLFAP